jgi:hypothetical protein
MLLSTIFTALVVPIQVHPTDIEKWKISPATIPQAVIDSARIIGLPRMKDMDKAMYKTIYINEFQERAIYFLHSRKAFTRNYINTTQ